MRSQPITFFIDCPTSKAKVALNALEQIGTKMEKMQHNKLCIYISCGSRIDILSGVKNNCKVNFKNDASIYVVSLHGGGHQTKRTIPTYAVVVVSPNHPLKNVPAQAETNKCRASPWEALRLRCMDATCPHLVGAPAAPAQTPFKDDGEDETGGEGNSLDIDEDGNAQDSTELDLLNATDVLKKAKCDPQEVWSFAKPVDHYKKILTGVLGLTPLSHGKIAVVTRTAHPGLPVAARQLGLEVLVCVEECPPHSKGHGDEQMLKMWKQLKWKEAEAAAAPTEVRLVGSSALTFATVLAPEKAQQIMQACSPPPELFCTSCYTNIC